MKSERKGYSFQPALLSPPQRASQSAFLLTSPHRDLASQSPPPPTPRRRHPTLYHSPLLASCPGDVTRHMVFSSIKPAKRFSQRRAKGEGERSGGGGGKRERSSSSCDWNGGERNAGSWVGGGGLNCVRQMRRERGAASAMCRTGAGLRWPSHKHMFAHTVKTVVDPRCCPRVSGTKLIKHADK